MAPNGDRSRALPVVQPLGEPLVDAPAAAPSWFKTELSTMFGIGWPMMVSFFCRFGMASTDAAFVGHITDGVHAGGTYLAAAMLSDMVTSLLVVPPLAFNQSLNALVSQAMGSGNNAMAGTWMQLSVFWLCLAHLPVLVGFFYVGPALHVLGFDPEVCDLAGRYAMFNVFWPIPNGVYQCMRFYFQAQGITRPAMYNNIFFLGFNAFLNWTFVFGGPFKSMGFHGFGFIGAALSLSCSRSLQPVAYWLYMFRWRKAHLQAWPNHETCTGFMAWTYQKRFLAMALPQIGTLIVQAAIGQCTTLLIAQLGQLAVACSSAAQAATMVFTGALTPTLAAVGGIRCGFYLGSGNAERAKDSSWICLVLNFVIVALVSVVVIPLRRQVMGAVTSDETVVGVGATLLAPVLLGAFASTFVAVGTGGVLTSQGRPTMVTVLSLLFEIPLSLGSVAIAVLVYHVGVAEVFWVQSAVVLLEALVVGEIVRRSDWEKYAREAQARQEADSADAGVSMVTPENGDDKPEEGKP